MNNYELIESYAKKGESHNIMSAVADKICELLKKDLTNFVLGRYPIKQRTDE